jgi:hypothetical protein
MKSTMVQGRIEGLGKFYWNGLEQLEIAIVERDARGLPFVEGEGVQIANCRTCS